MAKHQSKSQVYKSNIAKWPDIKPAINTDYTYLLQIEDRKVGEATDISKCYVNILIITCILVLYQIYNHLALGLACYN